MIGDQFLAEYVGERSWAAAAEVLRWQSAHDRWAPPRIVMAACGRHSGRPNVVFALTSGRLPRAWIDNDGRVHASAHDWVSIHETPTAINGRDIEQCAALAIYRQHFRAFAAAVLSVGPMLG